MIPDPPLFNSSFSRKPTAWDLQQLYRSYPHTTIATCTRWAAAKVNDLAIFVLYATWRKRKLTTVPVDWEANPANYDKDQGLLEVVIEILYIVSFRC